MYFRMYEPITDKEVFIKIKDGLTFTDIVSDKFVDDMEKRQEYIKNKDHRCYRIE